MDENLALSELAERLKKRNEEELRQVEQIEREKLEKLSENLQKLLNQEAIIIEKDIEKNKNLIEKSLIKTKKEITSLSRDLRESVADEMADLWNEVRMSGPKMWFYRLFVPAIMTASVLGGAWGVSEYLSRHIQNQMEQIEELKAEAAVQKRTMNRYVVRSWNNAIGLEKKPEVWQDRKTGLWIVRFAE